MIAQILAQAAADGPTEVLAALRQASAKTGSDFQYLLGTAMRESSLQTQAKSTTSSASGLFQFIDQTWLSLIKHHGAGHGLGQFSDAIQEGPGGRYTVASANLKSAILALRQDPQVAALMAGEAAADTKAGMESSLGREVSCGELYAAHFLGQGNACKLISLNQSTPGQRADGAFPQAAKANPHVFYAADGTPKTIGEVYDWAVSLPGAAQAARPAAARQAVAPQLDSGGNILTTDLANSDAPRTRHFWHTPMTTSLPQPTLYLTPDVVEILASLDAGTAFAGRRPV